MYDQIVKAGQFDGLFPTHGMPRVIVLRHSIDGSVSTFADTEINGYTNINKTIEPLHKEERITLRYSVAVAGCDLLSSCLYTGGTCAVYAGKVQY